MILFERNSEVSMPNSQKWPSKGGVEHSADSPFGFVFSPSSCMPAEVTIAIGALSSLCTYPIKTADRDGPGVPSHPY